MHSAKTSTLIEIQMIVLKAKKKAISGTILALSHKGNANLDQSQQEEAQVVACHQ